MQSVIFVGIQASGKSSFYKEKFADSHIRINLDMVKTRHREKSLINCCLSIGQAFVIDNTNYQKADRLRYIPAIKEKGFKIKLFYFSSNIKDCLKRNESREKPIPELGILGTYKKLELPSMSEEFDEMFYVKLENRKFNVSKSET